MGLGRSAQRTLGGVKHYFLAFLEEEAVRASWSLGFMTLSMVTRDVLRGEVYALFDEP